jgi:putative transposase
MSLPWDKQRVTECTEVHEVAEKFIRANGFFASVPVMKF